MNQAESQIEASTKVKQAGTASTKWPEKTAVVPAGKNASQTSLDLVDLMIKLNDPPPLKLRTTTASKFL